ncbi:MAG: GGDEF domain-containing protein [Phycisphaerales bacterium]|nr:GGDEF domain-containing protein [Phycisphaerales bacterium]
MHSAINKQHDAGDNWRIVLVGRTGLDQSLRRLADVELIRARDTFDAIGELSDPIDGSSPRAAAVIVARGLLVDESEAAGFVGGLRLVDPKVRVLCVDDLFDACDGIVEAHGSGQEVLDAVRLAKPKSVVVTKPVGKPVVKPVSEPVSEPEPDKQDASDSLPHQRVMTMSSIEAATSQHSAGIGPMDDQRVLDALIAGKSITSAAIGLIRARCGRDDIDFVQGVSAEGCAVMLGRAIVGMLVCEDEHWGTGELSAHAMWLSKWLKLEAQHSELRDAAFTDSLTGAWNRRYFTRFLDAAIVESRKARQPLTVLYFDIDGFKQYNDQFGHAAGDEILVETVKLMQSVIRPSDRVCRVGGDEFVVIFYEPHGPRDPLSRPPESIYSIAMRFQQQICKHEFPKLGAEAPSTLTVSGGIASFPWDGADAESLLDRADQLAMESKRQGKNAITLGPGAESVCRLE